MDLQQSILQSSEMQMISRRIFREYLETLRQSPKAEGAEQIYTHGEKEIMAEKDAGKMAFQ